jgi:hypothetical protein
VTKERTTANKTKQQHMNTEKTVWKKARRSEKKVRNELVLNVGDKHKRRSAAAFGIVVFGTKG